MFCSNCGKEHPDGQKFCSYCGYKLDGAALAPVQTDYKNKEKKIQVLKKYLRACVNKYIPVYIGDDVPGDKCAVAISNYAMGANPKEVIGMIDESFRNNGKAGMLFTLDGFYCKHAYKGANMFHFNYSDNMIIERTNSLVYELKILNEMLMALAEADMQQH